MIPAKVAEKNMQKIYAVRVAPNIFGMVENAGTGTGSRVAGTGYRVMLMRDSRFVSFCMIDHSKVANVKALRVA